MTNRLSEESEESKGLIAAREELEVLEKLAEGVSEKIRDFSKTRRFDGKIDNTEFALHENKYAQLKAYEELAHACYGRAVTGTEVDENEEPKGNFAYRITQANVGYVDGKCVVVARNSPLATALVTALPGDSREVAAKNRDRFFDIGEVRTFDGPVSLLSRTQQPNFRSATIRRIGTNKPVVLRDLRSVVYSLQHAAITDAKSDEASHSTVEPADPAWLSDWSDVYLGEAEDSSLGHQFFTQTTIDQERALNNPRGLTFVEGIAGSGKTSVALGRLKFFANFATGDQREYYGLQNASDADFSPVGMVGFVLSPSLKRYLKDTAAMLGLERLPILDFEEFRIELCGRFGITDKFKRKKGDAPLIRSRFDWLRALDAAVARAAGKKLRDNLKNAPEVSALVVNGVGKIIEELLRAEPRPNFEAFNLDGLAVRILDIVADAELRARETKIRNEFQVRQTVEDERYRREKASLEREMRNLQKESEKKLVSPMARSLLSGIVSHELLLPAISLEEFPNLARLSFGRPAEGPLPDDLNDAIVSIRQLVVGVAGRPALPDADLVTLAIMAGMIAEGFDYVDQKGELGHLRQVRSYSAVFIDEVQDFTEIEIVLMGMTAAAPYHQITLSGDRKQRLQTAGAQSYEHLFPKVPRSHQNKPFFLDLNFRQRNELASFSSGFRGSIQNDNSIVFKADELPNPLNLYKYGTSERMTEFIEGQIRSVPRHATIAIIVPTEKEAETWYGLLEEELASYHRPPRLSRRDDLTRRVNVHFTEVREAKGLEFNVVIIPDIGAFSLDSDIGQNQAYVAISRAKHSLILGCSRENSTRPGIEALERSGLVRMKEIPTH